MEITQDTIRKTAELLNITLVDSELEQIKNSFQTLIDYFAVLDRAMVDIKTEVPGDAIERFREDAIINSIDPKSLIEKSEEYEDNFVLIPNVL